MNDDNTDNDWKKELEDLTRKSLNESLIRSPNNLQRWIFQVYKKHVPINIITKVLKGSAPIEIQSDKKIEDFKIVADIGSYQVDLTFYEQFSRKNKGYIGLLVCVEIPTRLVYIELIKNKTAAEVASKFENILKRVKNKMVHLTMDGGLEFINKKFEELLNEWNITPRFTLPGQKNNTAIVERMNRTIREKILTHFNLTNDVIYYNIIENHQLENSINNSHNRSIGNNPNDITTPMIEKQNEELREHNHELFVKHNFKIGDKVRIRLKKSKLGKLGNKYSSTVHTITDISGLHANLDNDISKWWTLNQLIKTNLNNTN